MSKKNTNDPAVYREKRKKQLKKAKKVTSGKAMTPNAKKILTRVIACAVALIIVALVAFIIAHNSGMPERTKTAVKVGDTNISVAEYNYFYNTSAQSFINQYSSILSQMGFDTSKPYDEQYYSEADGLTWADFFHNQTLSSIRETVMLCKEAEKEGYKMTDEDKQSVKDTMKTISDNAKQNNVSPSYYLSYVYGKGTNKSVAKKVISMYTLSSSYATYKHDTYAVSDEEVETYYNEHSNDFDYVTYRSYTANGSLVAGEDEELTDEQVAANKAEAKGIADDFNGRITDEASFNTIAGEVSGNADSYADENATLTSEATFSNLNASNAEMAEWLYDSARKAGDHAVFEHGDSSYIVAYFVERGRNDYNTQDVRHILFQFETETDADGNSTIVEGSKEEQYAKAQEVLDEFNAGEQTEEAFAELAKEYSQDPGSASNGGLYEGVYKGQMVSEFENWCFDAERKTGDTGIIETSYGYHVMFYVGANKPYYQIQVNDSICDTAYQEFTTEAIENYPITEVRENLPLTIYGGNGTPVTDESADADTAAADAGTADTADSADAEGAPEDTGADTAEAQDEAAAE